MTAMNSPCMDFTLPSNTEWPASLPSCFQLFQASALLCDRVWNGSRVYNCCICTASPAQLDLAHTPHLALCALIKYNSRSSLADGNHKHLVFTGIRALLHILEPSASYPRPYLSIAVGLCLPDVYYLFCSVYVSLLVITSPCRIY